MQIELGKKQHQNEQKEKFTYENETIRDATIWLGTLCIDMASGIKGFLCPFH